MDPTINSIISIWQTSGQAHNNLWTFYIVVVSGVIGFSFSKTFHQVRLNVRRALFAIFTLFLISNIISLWNNLDIYNAAVTQLQKLAADKLPLGKVVNGILEIPQYVIAGLHVALDIGALIIVGSACLKKGYVTEV